MNNSIILAVKAVFISALILAASISLQAQTSPKNDNPANIATAANPQTVIATQGGQWNVGIDAAKNVVKVASSDAEPVTVKLLGNNPGRKPFQVRVSANVPNGSTGADAILSIPAGKRMVIENISAIARTDPGTHMTMQLFSYFDNGDGIGDLSDITFHRIALIDQGTFVNLATSAANHKVLIFADEQIGTAHFSVSLQVRMDAAASGGTNQGQVTLSGYLEDLQ